LKLKRLGAFATGAFLSLLFGDFTFCLSNIEESEDSYSIVSIYGGANKLDFGDSNPKSEEFFYCGDFSGLFFVLKIEVSIFLSTGLPNSNLGSSLFS